MKTITRTMMKEYNLKKLGYDFMGYTFNRPEDLSFHHLVVPRKECKEKGLGDGYIKWNGAILTQDTSHIYLHSIERYDREIFLEITKEMIEENLRGEVSIQNLKRIREMLLTFEYLYKDKRTSKGNLVVKPEYKQKRITLY